MKNYLEHDIKAKYIEGILNQNQDWQWLVSYIESEFDLSDIYSWKEFENKNGYLYDIYYMFIRIIKVTDNTLTFKYSILAEIYKVAKYYLGKLSKKEIINNLKYNYSKILFLLVWITILENKDNNPKLIIDKRICLFKNFWQLINFDSIWLAAEELENYIEKSISIIDNNITKCIYDNINRKFYKCTQNFIKKYQKKFLNANAFSFKNITHRSIISWQEQYLLDMIQINIKNKEIIPSIQMEGICIPDISLWTKECIIQLKEYFNNNKIALFILETIAYVLHNEIPSTQTIEQHCQLFVDKLVNIKNGNDIFCSSFEIISYLFKANLFLKYKNESFYKHLIFQLNKISNPQLILYFQENIIPTTSTQKIILKEYFNNIYKNIDNINNVQDLICILENRDIPKSIDEKYFNKICRAFSKYATQEISVNTGLLFFNFMIFILATKHSDSFLDKKSIECTAIKLLTLWQQEYYEKVVHSMNEYSYEKMVSTEDISNFSKSVIENPIIFAIKSMPIREKDITAFMKIASEAPMLSIITNININKVFPYIEQIENICQRHEIDELLKKIIEKIKKEQYYKFLNLLESNYYIFNLHKTWIKQIIYNTTIFNQEEKLYAIISEKCEEIELIPYNKKISLAHTTQLFPILETKIREISIKIGIIPFNEDNILKYKDASSILRKIISVVYNESKQLAVVSDLFFIYNVMYNDNSLNIRNECLHGRDYLSGNSLKIAFKLSLISLYLIIKRIENINENISKI